MFLSSAAMNREVCVFRLVPTGLVDSMNEKTVGEPRAVTWMSQQISKWLVSGLVSGL